MCTDIVLSSVYWIHPQNQYMYIYYYHYHFHLTDEVIETQRCDLQEENERSPTSQTPGAAQALTFSKSSESNNLDPTETSMLL